MKTSDRDWLKQRRRALDLTQQALAQRVGCATVTIKKIEAGSYRPSKQVAARLAAELAIPPSDYAAFMQYIRPLPAATADAAPP
ncbi:MAG: helix-turn-helix transcriptional regulator, partial [Chloroflexota bacterium]|nr:helix-turn-helix transcriptional regulator [Chloroflexota bacterium]